MPLVLRIILILVSVINMYDIMRKIRKFKLQIEDSIFWIVLSFALIILAVFPGITIFLAKMIGIQSPVNMIFLVIVFLLFLKTFRLTLEISQLQQKVKELVQQLALKEHEEEQK